MVTGAHPCPAEHGCGGEGSTHLGQMPHQARTASPPALPQTPGERLSSPPRGRHLPHKAPALGSLMSKVAHHARRIKRKTATVWLTRQHGGESGSLLVPRILAAC
jgi:hypothetical protein